MSSRPSIDATSWSPIGKGLLANVRAITSNGIKDFCVPGFYMKDGRLRFCGKSFISTEMVSEFIAQPILNMIRRQEEEIKAFEIQYEDRMEENAIILEYDEGEFIER